MKKLILIAIFAFCGLAATAQDTPTYTSRISLSYSAAFPLGEFNSQDFDDAYPAFATQGSLLKLSYTYKIRENFALGATTGWRRNPFDLSQFVKDNDERVQHKESKPWQTVFTLADVQFLVPAKAGFFYLKGSLGAAFSRSAFLNITTPYGNVTRSADNSTAFAYGLSSGAHIDIKQFGLGLEAGILSTKPAFEVENAQGKVIRYKQPMTTLNAGLFASYAF